MLEDSSQSYAVDPDITYCALIYPVLPLGVPSVPPAGQDIMVLGVEGNLPPIVEPDDAKPYFYFMGIEGSANKVRN